MRARVFRVLFNFHLSFCAPALHLAFWHILLFIHHLRCHNLNCHINLGAHAIVKMGKKRKEFGCVHMWLSYLVSPVYGSLHAFGLLAPHRHLMDRCDDRASTARHFLLQLFVLCVLECHQMQTVHAKLPVYFILQYIVNSTLFHREECG